MQILGVDLEVFESRRQTLRDEKASHKLKWYEDEEKICVYIVDIDNTMLKAEVNKNSFEDAIAERNFRNTYCDRGLRLKREI